MRAPKIALGRGFVNHPAVGPGPVMVEKKVYDPLAGQKVEAGALGKALGKPAMHATGKELKTYVDGAKTEAARKKRQAQVNLMKGHKKGLKAKGSKVPSPHTGKKHPAKVK